MSAHRSPPSEVDEHSVPCELTRRPRPRRSNDLGTPRLGRRRRRRGCMSHSRTRTGTVGNEQGPRRYPAYAAASRLAPSSQPMIELPSSRCVEILLSMPRSCSRGVGAASPRAMPAGRRRCCARGVRVQSAATAAGRADRRPLLPGGCAAVRPADAAADAVGVAHRQPRGAVPHPRRHRHRDGRVRRRLRGHHAHPRVGVRLPTPDPVRRRALQAVGAGAVPADARGRAV